jgi:hypothetical protein
VTRSPNCERHGCAPWSPTAESLRDQAPGALGPSVLGLVASMVLVPTLHRARATARRSQGESKCRVSPVLRLWTAEFKFGVTAGTGRYDELGGEFRFVNPATWCRSSSTSSNWATPVSGLRPERVGLRGGSGGGRSAVNQRPRAHPHQVGPIKPGGSVHRADILLTTGEVTEFVQLPRRWRSRASRISVKVVAPQRLASRSSRCRARGHPAFTAGNRAPAALSDERPTRPSPTLLGEPPCSGLGDPMALLVPHDLDVGSEVVVLGHRPHPR